MKQLKAAKLLCCTLALSAFPALAQQATGGVRRWPWQHQFHEALEVRVRLAGELVPLAEQLFPVKAQRVAETAEVSITATDLDGLVTYVLSLGASAKVTSPPRAVDRARELAQRVLDAHPEAAS